MWKRLLLMGITITITTTITTITDITGTASPCFVELF